MCATSAQVFDGELNIVYSSDGTLLIGLISDTHISSPNEKLPLRVRAVFSGVDLILHAGDIWIPSVLDELESIAPVMAAWGDDDMKADLGEDKRMLEKHTLSLGGITLWLMHIKPPYGQISPKEGIFKPKSDIEGPRELPKVVVFGHTHSDTIEHYKGVLLVNPGSATWPNYFPRLGTVALLDINSGEAEARIVPLE
jgi:putative phosphoesterase